MNFKSATTAVSIIHRERRAVLQIQQASQNSAVALRPQRLPIGRIKQFSCLVITQRRKLVADRAAAARAAPRSPRQGMTCARRDIEEFFRLHDAGKANKILKRFFVPWTSTP